MPVFGIVGETKEPVPTNELSEFWRLPKRYNYLFYLLKPIYTGLAQFSKILFYNVALLV